MFDVDELNHLSVSLKNVFSCFETLRERLAYLNRTEQLDNLLDLLGISSADSVAQKGIIVVVGESEVTKQCLLAIGKECGISKDRFEFCLSYDEAKRFNFKKTQYSDKYSLIMVGPIPHSSYGSGDFSSALSAIRNTEGYPPVVSLGFQSLKITKSNFKNTLEELIRNNIISK